MGIEDLFSTTFLFSISIIILLVGTIFVYFNYKIAEQDFKLKNMMDIIYTMSINHNNIKNEIDLLVLKDTKQDNKTIEIKSELISVSDDEEYEEDEKDEDYEEDEEDEQDEEEDDEDDEEIEEDEEYDEEDEDLVLEIVDDIDEKDFEFDQNENEDELYEEEIELDHLEELDESEEMKDQTEESNLENNNTNKTINLDIDLGMEFNFMNIKHDSNIIPMEELFEKEHSEQNETTKHSEENEIKTIHLDLNESDLLSIKEDIKNFDANESEKPDEISKVDYKKLTLKELKELVVVMGLVTDSSKLKKNELLSMIENHN